MTYLHEFTEIDLHSESGRNSLSVALLSQIARDYTDQLVNERNTLMEDRKSWIGERRRMREALANIRSATDVPAIWEIANAALEYEESNSD